MIYLISPYTHQNALVRAERSRKVGRVMLELAQSGIHSIAPAFLGHQLEEKFKTDLPYEFWMSWSRDLMAKCSEAYLLPLEGWRESTGVRSECELAVLLTIPLAVYPIKDAEEITNREVRDAFDLAIPRVKHMRYSGIGTKA